MLFLWNKTKKINSEWTLEKHMKYEALIKKKNLYNFLKIKLGISIILTEALILY